MKKRWVAATLTALMALSMTACGGGKTAETTAAPAETKAEETKAEESKEAFQGFEVKEEKNEKKKKAKKKKTPIPNMLLQHITTSTDTAITKTLHTSK